MAAEPDPYLRHVEERDRILAEYHELAARGISFPHITVAAARRRGLTLAALCAVLEMETGGGSNVFGHDQVRWPQIIGGPVTRERYLRYKAMRIAGLGAQGVGPMQLTYPGFQDVADRRGGCWRQGVNIDYGAEIFAGYVRTSGYHAAAKAYNGATAYADRFMVVRKKWRDRFAGDRRRKGPPGN